MCRNSESQGYSFLIILLTILCTLLLALNILIKSFVSEEDLVGNIGNFRKSIEEFPFFCDDLSLSADEDYDIFNVKKKLYKYFLYKNRYVCSFWNLTVPLRKFVERQSRRRLASGLEGKRNLQCGNESLREPSGYLSAAFRKVSRHQTYDGKGPNLVLHWDKHPKNSFISEDLVYHKGEIKVPEGRFYFLYSSVLINLTNVMIHFGKAYRFILQVCVNSRGYERTVLYKSQSYQHSGSNSISSLAVAGHVYVASGDVVYVKVSEASRIIISSVGNMFGMMPLR
ncbi:uncharacterized protein LOC128558505 isoform X1 [Mercenaria mercenaria]|uniref:uncharacterized protein LOC128558505 isoform X1 n=1 Tax=Mercenaria mercenaria TaxID=6596 RepID=UPI00234EC557|nr:uncharacterized protein LOC128558505 isoform X1 [Mercenaria mercenaria]